MVQDHGSAAVEDPAEGCPSAWLTACLRRLTLVDRKSEGGTSSPSA
ncbi:hypothetical protein [Streptomyces shenzhenensis]|nr:hypothetical protein [Streptomyces shenzhenensis]